MPEKTSFINKITIIGLGLIGSSLARALKEGGHASRIIGCSNSLETLEKAKALGIIDAAVPRAADAVKRSDIVVLATPLAAYTQIITEIAPELKPTTILTDVGSVKQYVIDIITPHLRRGQPFIPAHPIAGTEKSGVENGFAELFRGKKTILTPVSGHYSKAASETITGMWQRCGARVEVLKAQEHDRIYAHMSHAVQLLSYTYAHSLAQSGEAALAAIEKETDAELTGFMRLSASNPAMWGEISFYNRQPITKALNTFLDAYESLLSLIRNEDYTAFIQALTSLSIRRANARAAAAKVTEEPIKRSYSASNPYFVPGVFLPKLIAASAMEAFEDTDYAGSGFWGFTATLTNLHAISEERIGQHREAILTQGERFAARIRETLTALETAESSEALTAFY